MMENVNDEVLFRLQCRHQTTASDAALSSTNFNINSLTVERFLTLFCFRPSKINTVSELTGWSSGRTKRSRYEVTPFIATCIMLCRLSSPTRLVDIQPMYGMRSSALSEVFCEVFKTLIETKVYLLESFYVSLMLRHTTTR